jgi:hypothetical protein
MRQRIFQPGEDMSESHNPCIGRRFSEGTERRLEEMRQILRETEPVRPPTALQRLDAESIEDRRAFKRRFGCDWPLRFHREALVQLRRERDWTDNEVKLFLFSGALRRGPFGVHADASLSLAIFGGLLVAMMLLFTSTCILFVVRSPSVEVVARGSAVMFGFVGVAWIAYQLYIRPWRIQRRVPD